jgi:hypothetical protein
MGGSVAKTVAFLALLAVMSSAQCLNLCAINPCDVNRNSSTPESCHHSSGSSQPETPQQSNDCAHHSMLAGEKKDNSIGAAAVSLPVLSLFLLHSIPVSTEAKVRAETLPPRVQTKAVILRI